MGAIIGHTHRWWRAGGNNNNTTKRRSHQGVIQGILIRHGSRAQDHNWATTSGISADIRTTTSVSAIQSGQHNWATTSAAMPRWPPGRPPRGRNSWSTTSVQCQVFGSTFFISSASAQHAAQQRHQSSISSNSSSSSSRSSSSSPNSDNWTFPSKLPGGGGWSTANRPEPDVHLHPTNSTTTTTTTTKPRWPLGRPPRGQQQQQQDQLGNDIRIRIRQPSWLNVPVAPREATEGTSTTTGQRHQIQSVQAQHQIQRQCYYQQLQQQGEEEEVLTTKFATIIWTTTAWRRTIPDNRGMDLQHWEDQHPHQVRQATTKQ